MEYIHKKFKSETLEGDWVITIGNFDGYHLGHQALVNQVLSDKDKINAKGGIVTFDPHPKQVLQSQIPFRHIYSNETKWRFLEHSGLDACFVIPFTKEFSSLSPKEFLSELFQFVRLKKLIVGYDFNFGKAREGSASFIAQEAEKYGIAFQQLPAVQIGELTVSSTMIRRLLFEGDFNKVSVYLGRQWSVTGKVLKGKKIGNTIGFPTMNLEPEVLLPLRKGVFCCYVEIKGVRYEAVCNVGVNPTFNGKTLKVESHVFKFNEDVYGETITVYPVKFLREEVKFDSVDELIKQIQNDVDVSMQFFQNRNSHYSI